MLPFVYWICRPAAVVLKVRYAEWTTYGWNHREFSGNVKPLKSCFSSGVYCFVVIGTIRWYTYSILIEDNLMLDPKWDCTQLLSDDIFSEGLKKSKNSGSWLKSGGLCIRANVNGIGKGLEAGLRICRIENNMHRERRFLLRCLVLPKTGNVILKSGFCFER